MYNFISFLVYYGANRNMVYAIKNYHVESNAKSINAVKCRNTSEVFGGSEDELFNRRDEYYRCQYQEEAACSLVPG